MNIKTSFSPLPTESAIAQLEAYIGSILPHSYREFLIRENGGVPELPYFVLQENGATYADSVVRYFLGISENFNLDLKHNFDIYVAARRLPSFVLPIAVDPGGNLLVLLLSGIDRGALYFWDHELEGVTTDSSDMSSL